MNLQEINKLVAEKVMNWKLKEMSHGDFWTDENEGWRLKQLWKPTTNIDDAWLVVKKLNKKYTVDVRDTLNDGAGCYISEFDESSECLFHVTGAEERTAPLAICIAALKSVGVEVEIDGIN